MSRSDTDPVLDPADADPSTELPGRTDQHGRRPGDDPEHLAVRLGFARGVAPSKWARRWEESGAQPLELIPLPASGRRIDGLDVVLERVAPGAQPEGTEGDEPERHAVRLYSESVALVIPADHELAGDVAADREALELVTLLAHPDHAPQWPEPEAWKDPSWAPKDAAAALELVATGLGAILLPLPLARHLAAKRAHAVLPLRLDPPLPGTAIWASWAVERDAPDVQQLIGVLRGRTARSGRPSAADAAAAADAPQRRARPAAKKPAQKALPKNSRGAQLAAAKAKAEAKKRAKAQEKKRKRR